MKLSDKEWLRYSLIAAIAVFLAVCINPSTSWVMRRSAAVVAGKFSNTEENLDSVQLIVRRGESSLIPEPVWQSKDQIKTLELAATAMGKTEDVVADGIIARNAAGALSTIFRKDKTAIPPDLAGQLVQELDATAVKEPNNMLFPMLSMFAVSGVGDKDATAKYRALAATRPRYTSYVQAEAEREWQAYLDKHSYDGEPARIFAYYGVALPHLSLVRNTETQHLKGVSRTDPRRLEWLKIAHRLYTDADTAIEILVAVTAMDMAIGVDPTTASAIGPPDKRLPYLREQASKFKLVHPTSEKLVDDLITAKERLSSGRAQPFHVEPLGLPWTPLGISAMVVLFVAILAGLLRSLIERSTSIESSQNLAPHALIAGYLLTRSSMPTYTEALLWTSLALVVPAVLAAVIPNPKAGAFVAIGTGILFLLGGPTFGLLTEIGIFSGLILAASFVPLLKHLTIPAAVVALSYGCISTSLAIQPNFGPLVSVGWLLVVSVPLQHLRTRTLAIFIAGAAGLFVAGVAVQVSENQTLRASTNLFAEEVKELRRSIENP